MDSFGLNIKRMDSASRAQAERTPAGGAPPSAIRGVVGSATRARSPYASGSPNASPAIMRRTLQSDSLLRPSLRSPARRGKGSSF